MSVVTFFVSDPKPSKLIQPSEGSFHYGDKDATFQWLATAYQDHDINLELFATNMRYLLKRACQIPAYQA